MIASAPKGFSCLVGKDTSGSDVLFFEENAQRLVHQNIDFWIDMSINDARRKVFLKNIDNRLIGEGFCTKFCCPHTMRVCEQNKEWFLLFLVIWSELFPPYKTVVQILVEFCCFSLHEHEIVSRIKDCSVV